MQGTELPDVGQDNYQDAVHAGEAEEGDIQEDGNRLRPKGICGEEREGVEIVGECEEGGVEGPGEGEGAHEQGKPKRRDVVYSRAEGPAEVPSVVELPGNEKREERVEFEIERQRCDRRSKCERLLEFSNSHL